MVPLFQISWHTDLYNLELPSDQAATPPLLSTTSVSQHASELPGDAGTTTHQLLLEQTYIRIQSYLEIQLLFHPSSVTSCY